MNVTGGDTATMLANAAKKYEKAVGLMVFTHSETGPLPHCTAWAIKSNVFLTNAHCFKRVAKYRKIPGVTWYVILNRDPSKKFRMLEWKIHPRYGERSANFDGKVNKISPFDVGLFKIDGKVDVTFPIAPREELKKISSGYPVATLGFPQEGLVGKNVSVRDPVASMQTGIIVAMTDYWDGDSGFAKNTMLKHNMGTAGGASGSPMFNRKGEVIGEHEVTFSSGKEIITLNHESFDRALYSEGALLAAKWLLNKRPGLYSMRDLFKI